ncbi:hypothetical protein Pelo_6228 [Pelomyxa schiedti]|nr:hypothetical protein Pelo_6228 [Pelomyxa schiedti]
MATDLETSVSRKHQEFSATCQLIYEIILPKIQKLHPMEEKRQRAFGEGALLQTLNNCLHIAYFGHQQSSWDKVLVMLKNSLTLLAMYCASLWDYTIAASLTLGFGFLQQVLPSCIDIKAPTSAILLGAITVELYVWLFPSLRYSLLGDCGSNLKALCNFLTWRTYAKLCIFLS